MNIIVIEDEKNLADAIVRILSDAHYHAEAVYDGTTGYRALASNLYDAAIVDRMLPGKDGVDLIRELRHNSNSMPVLMLTARTSTTDKVEGLDAGADDYMTKPFEADELLARLRALTRRQGDVMLDQVSFADFTLDLTTHDLTCKNHTVHLSGKEFEVLKMLLNSPSRVVSKQDLLTYVWGVTSATNENSVEAYVSFLRKKLMYVHSRVQITTLRMLGYRLEEL